ncbi:tRNA pseudouridine(55) synthase TruB [Sphingomonas montana]|uniref:tRNA pseudouridine(55) synthase TruB n=1 Tax=Sphingomonas montana TaxID=1843236 RepID=UPI00096C57DF|nr:tRNA pseudouridine(55) synthase TruB [Sphingomonas montana]
MNGWLVIDKPLGPGSTQIVSAVKRALRSGGYAKVKVGHGGTLDPLATGVLPIALGEATKLAGRMLDADKAYDFTIAFGAATDTIDLEGKVVATSNVRPTLVELLGVLPRFTGPIEQVPPAYSAIKIDGERAYDRARAGETFEIKMRGVTVHALEVVPDAAGAHRAGDTLSEITLTARVSKGTYIRSLARDIAEALGTVGHVTMLRRTKAGPFVLGQAISLDKLANLGQDRTVHHALLPLTAGLDDIPAFSVTPDQAGALRQGRKLIGIAVPPGLHLALDAGTPVALVEQGESGVRVVRGFNLVDVEDIA